MLISGDVVGIDLGQPVGHEAGFVRPGIVVSAQRILDVGPSVVQVVPLTFTLSRRSVEVVVDADRTNGLVRSSAAQCQHVRSVGVQRLGEHAGNVGAAVLTQVRDVLGLLLDVHD